MQYFRDYYTFSFQLFDIGFNLMCEEWFAYRRRLKPYPNPHYHKTWEIYFVKQGSIEVDCSGENKTFYEGEITVIPPKAEHCILKSSDNADFSSVRFWFEPDSTNQINLSFVQMLEKHAFANVSAGEDIWEEFDRMRAQFRKYIQCKDTKIWLYQKMTADALSLMSSVLEKLSSESDFHCQEDVAEKDLQGMIIEFFMMYECDANIKVTDLARVLNYSVSQVNRILCQNFGMSFKEMNKEIKIKKAKYFLTKTNFSVQKIAEIMGFSEAKAFNRFFKNCEGITPSQYKRYMAEQKK